MSAPEPQAAAAQPTATLAVAMLGRLTHRRGDPAPHLA